MTSPLPFRWNGEAFEPLPRARRACDEAFVIGEVYTLAEEKARSSVSHRHYFAMVHEAWATLPEHMAAQFPTAEHLRKFALIKTGFADSRQIVAASKAEALRLAAFIRPLDEYGLVTVEGAVVTHWTAQSQSTRAMGGKLFQESKSAVLDYIAGLSGAQAGDLGRAA
jgi:hypothetical protein